jgi:hypothetical protein
MWLRIEKINLPPPPYGVEGEGILSRDLKNVSAFINMASRGVYPASPVF